MITYGFRKHGKYAKQKNDLKKQEREEYSMLKNRLKGLDTGRILTTQT